MRIFLENILDTRQRILLPIGPNNSIRVFLNPGERVEVDEHQVTHPTILRLVTSGDLRKVVEFGLREGPKIEVIPQKEKVIEVEFIPLPLHLDVEVLDSIVNDDVVEGEEAPENE